MKKLKSNQSGIAHISIVIVVVVAVVISLVGYRVYKNSSKVDPVTTTSTGRQETPSPPYRCGSQEASNFPRPESFDAKYTPPKGWTSTTQLNGITHESPDLANEGRKVTYGDGYGYGISTGASLLLYVDSYCTEGNGEKADLQRWGDLDDDGSVGEFISVAGLPGVRNTRTDSAAYDNTQSISFLKDGYIYHILLTYGYGKDNPYPNVVDELAKSISF